MVVRIVIGVALTIAAGALAGRRLYRLYRVARSGQPAPERIEAVRAHPGRDASIQLAEVTGQRKLLKWAVPGAAHALTFWGFIVLLLTIVEAYGNLFSKTFAIPGIGHWAVTGGSAAAPAAPGCDGRAHRQTDQHRADRGSPGAVPDTISTACPYCLVMLGDAISAKKASGEARETLEVVDVAQILMRSVTPPAEGVAWRAPDGSAVFLPWSALTGTMG